MRVATIKPRSKTAGLSLDELNNERIEVFLAGCNIAASGHPCPDCFNQDLWNGKFFPNISSKQLFNDVAEISKATKNKYITIVGGEPLDQYQELADFIERLYCDYFHIVVITHYTMKKIRKDFPLILKWADTIIDGVYDRTKRTFDECKTPGIYQVIGSSNQKIWHQNDDCTWSEVDKTNSEEIKAAYFC